jgi:hypothetical protein
MRTIFKLKNFVKSLWFHIGYGLPKCSQEQINNRHKICIQCDFYDIKNQECLQCGCNISNRRIFLNKLAWADQKCPIDKWGSEI